MTAGRSAHLTALPGWRPHRRLARAAIPGAWPRLRKTGGVLSFGQVGALAEPLMFSTLLGLTGSYGAGFIACGLPALLVGVTLLRQDASAQEDKRRRT